MAEEYCWAITQAAGLLGSSVLDSLVCAYLVDHIKIEFRREQSLSCAGPSETAICNCLYQ
jgi:hypothetical protein